MAKIPTRITVIGYGNVGKGVCEAVNRNEDMRLVGIISRRGADDVRRAAGSMQAFSDVAIFSPKNFMNPSNQVRLNEITDVAILCGGSKQDLFSKEDDPNRYKGQGPFYAQFFNTVDSFDTHSRIPDYFSVIDEIADKFGHVSVISAGWDPGTFSLERVLANAFVPGSKNYTFWGPGVSQGHSDAVRRIPGVRDARQYTLPVDDAIRQVRAGKNPELKAGQKHTRLVYVVLENNDPKERERVKAEIVGMPNYFTGYNTEVRFISEGEMRGDHSAYPHGGFVLTSGNTGRGNKALIEYRNEWASNPEATASILVACARACYRLRQEKRSGAFTMLDIPAAYLSPQSRETLLKEWM